MQKPFGAFLILILGLALSADRVDGILGGRTVEREKALRIQDRARELIEKEIDQKGFFEADDPEMGNSLELSSLRKIQDTVIETAEREYLVSGDFTDEAGRAERVDLFLRENGAGDFAVVDSILVRDRNQSKQEPL